MMTLVIFILVKGESVTKNVTGDSSSRRVYEVQLLSLAAGRPGVTCFT